MKVILKQDIKGVGKKDQVINAADGYARNFLFPKNLAIPADAGNMNNLKAKNESVQYRKGEDLKESKKIAEKMKTITVKISVKAGENGRLFGAVTAKEIAEALKYIPAPVEEYVPDETIQEVKAKAAEENVVAAESIKVQKTRKLKKAEMKELHISVEKENAASIKVIQKNGGVYERSFSFENEVADIYKIKL